MADARKFVLPGQPPGTTRRRPSPLLPGLGWFFSLFPRAREHGEFDGFFFPFLAVWFVTVTDAFSSQDGEKKGKKKLHVLCRSTTGGLKRSGTSEKRPCVRPRSMFLQSPRNPTLFFFLFLKKRRIPFHFRSLQNFALWPCGIFSWISFSFSFIGHVFALFFSPERKRLASLWRFADFSGQ